MADNSYLMGLIRPTTDGQRPEAAPTKPEDLETLGLSKTLSQDAPAMAEEPGWEQRYARWTESARSSTELPPEQEVQFKQDIMAGEWFKDWQRQYPDVPPERLFEDLTRASGDYNMRRAWQLKVQPSMNEADHRMHYPDAAPGGEMLKQPDHPTAWMQFFMQQYHIDPQSIGLNTREEAEAWSRSHR